MPGSFMILHSKYLYMIRNLKIDNKITSLIESFRISKEKKK